MTATHESTPNFREIISQNAQKGEPYRIKFMNDPVIYTGVPIAMTRLASIDNDQFDFKVVEPPEHSGVQHRSMGEIESMEKAV